MDDQQKNITLSSVTTAALVRELAKRPGVKRIIIDAYESKEIRVNGPAIVLEIID